MPRGDSSALWNEAVHRFPSTALRAVPLPGGAGEESHVTSSTAASSRAMSCGRDSR